MNSSHRFTTNTIHAGESKTSSATPIFLGATTDAQYLRDGNPTLDAFQEKVRSLEAAAAAVSTASGMAAISQTLMALLRPGSRIVTNQRVYYWATEFIHRVLPEFGIDVAIIDMRDMAQVDAALQTKTDVVYFEPLVNPTCAILDAVGIIKKAKAAGAITVVDNTFLSPALFNPLAHGADIVLHSATKFLCGHGDALAGIILADDPEMGERLVKTRNTFGGILSPINGYLLLRGIKTLSMRMERHCQNAQAVAELISASPNVAQVQYPGLESAAGHAIAKDQWRGFGSMMNIEFVDSGSFERFFKRIEMIKPWVSLGDPGTLAVGGENFGGELSVRMAVGLEDIADISAELQYALS